MAHYVRTVCVAVLALMLLVTASSASGAVEMPEGSAGQDPSEASPIRAGDEPRVEVGPVTVASPVEALGAERARTVSRTTECHQQPVTLTYTQLSFTGIKKWCYDGKRVTTGTMTVQQNIKPEHRYTDKRDGWVYVPTALEKTDKFITHKGVSRGAHVSTRQGRFELRIHGQSKPQAVYVPFVSRTGYGTGKCNGPKPTDLAPKLVAVNPVNGSTNVDRTKPIIGQLSMKAKEGTVNIGTFYAMNRETGEYVDANTGRYTEDESVIVIFPYEPLDQNTTYDVTLAAGPYGVLGQTGDPLVKGAYWSFTTGPS